MAENTQEPQRVVLLGEVRKGRAGNPGELRTFAVTPNGALPLEITSSASSSGSDGEFMLLSNSTNGKPIKVTGTGTGSTVTIHTAVTGATSFDRMYIFANNTSASDVTLTLEWGAATSPDCLIEVPIPGEHGLYRVVSGLPLNGGLTVKAFAGSANVINITGWVVRV